MFWIDFIMFIYFSYLKWVLNQYYWFIDKSINNFYLHIIFSESCCASMGTSQRLFISEVIPASKDPYSHAFLMEYPSQT